ncbi:MAG: DUF302 domain-containing protein [Cyclobacteriaceae bacterium]|nr:DUF302 domain-containing protein [Cyclobacteriaceae bacterium HetDA_MAG_MS6]
MHRSFMLVFFLSFASGSLFAQNITVYKSYMDVPRTTDKIVDIIKEKGLIFFETVSHDEIAKERGITIHDTKVILFEDPNLTTELIQCEQTAALDLPLKIMVWEENEDVYIGYIDPQLMKKRFLIGECNETLSKMTGLIVRIVNEAIRKR